MSKQIEELSKKYRNKESISIVTNYLDAVNWLDNHRVLCNEIPNVDSSIWDNARFDWYLDEDSEDMMEIYQWFIFGASECDIKYLEERFGLLFTYSDLLDNWVLCVHHYGTSWDYVYCQDSEADEFWKEQVEKEGK